MNLVSCVFFCFVSCCRAVVFLHLVSRSFLLLFVCFRFIFSLFIRIPQQIKKELTLERAVLDEVSAVKPVQHLVHPELGSQRLRADEPGDLGIVRPGERTEFIDGVLSTDLDHPRYARGRVVAHGAEFRQHALVHLEEVGGVRGRQRRDHDRRDAEAVAIVYRVKQLGGGDGVRRQVGLHDAHGAVRQPGCARPEGLEDGVAHVLRLLRVLGAPHAVLGVVLFRELRDLHMGVDDDEVGETHNARANWEARHPTVDLGACVEVDKLQVEDAAAQLRCDLLEEARENGSALGCRGAHVGEDCDLRL
eukprot:PhM_4_TR2873/c0_g1_i1/m.96899